MCPCKVQQQEPSAPTAICLTTAQAEDFKRKEQEGMEINQMGRLDTVCMHNKCFSTILLNQEQLLEVTSPLTYLWADLTQVDDRPTHEQIVLLLQRALVLVGSTSHSISMERRKTNKPNPTPWQMRIMINEKETSGFLKMALRL